MEILFINFHMMYKSKKKDTYDWFCAPGHIYTEHTYI